MTYDLREYIPVKNNYKIHNKELLIIMYCLKVWEIKLWNILKGSHIITDYKNIKYFVKKQYLNKR